MQPNCLVLWAGYTLELEGGHYYVGISQHVCKRVGDHFLSQGSRWTKLHKPVRVLEVVMILNEDPKDWEKRQTLNMMRQHGWANVRGGPYTRVDMRRAPRDLSIPNFPTDGSSTDSDKTGKL